MEDYLHRKCDQIDENHRRKAIQRILSKYGKPPPGELEGTPKIHMNQREQACSGIDGIPILVLYVPDLPIQAHYKDVKVFLAEEYGIAVREVHMGRRKYKSKFPYITFIRCKSVEDSLRHIISSSDLWLILNGSLQLLSKSEELNYRGVGIHAYPANKSQQRPIQVTPSLSMSSVDQRVNNQMEVSAAQSLPIVALRLIFRNLCLSDKVQFVQVCQNWAAAMRGDDYFDWSPKHVWGDSNTITSSIDTLSEMAALFNGVDFGWKYVILSGKPPVDHLRIAGNSEFIKLLNPHCVIELNLSGVELSSGALTYISKNFCNLRSFAIGHCTGPHDQILSQIIELNPLQALGIFDNHNVTGSFMSTASTSSTLTSITARLCPKLKSPYIATFFESSIALQSIEISQCQGLIRRIINSISRRNNEELKILRLEECPREVLTYWVRTADIESTLMAKTVPNNLSKNFESLSLAHNSWVQTGVLEQIAVSTSLSHIDLSYCLADASWWIVLSHAKNLKSLAINKLVKPLWGLGPNEWSSTHPTFHTFNALRDKLQKLEFRDYDELKYMPEGIVEFFQENTVLEVLDIRGCQKLWNFNFLNQVRRYRQRNASYNVLRVFSASTRLRYYSSVIELDYTPYEAPEHAPNYRLRQL